MLMVSKRKGQDGTDVKYRESFLLSNEQFSQYEYRCRKLFIIPSSIGRSCDRAIASGSARRKTRRLSLGSAFP